MTSCSLFSLLHLHSVPISLFLYLAFCLPLCLSVYLLACLFFLSMPLCLYVSVNLFVRPSVCLSVAPPPPLFPPLPPPSNFLCETLLFQLLLLPFSFIYTDTIISSYEFLYIFHPFPPVFERDHFKPSCDPVPLQPSNFQLNSCNPHHTALSASAFLLLNIASTINNLLFNRAAHFVSGVCAFMVFCDLLNG